MQKLNDLSRSLTALEPNSTLIAVIEMSLSSWLVAGIVPGVERQPLKKLAVDESALLKLLHRWREEAEKAGRRIERIAVAFEAGRDGFWLARWLKARGIKVVSVFLTGRPLFAGGLMNASDAFVAAWLPGTQGQGVADVLVAERGGGPRADFTGKLPFAWPDDARSPIAAPLQRQLDPEGGAQACGGEHVAERAMGDDRSGAHQHGVCERSRDVLDVVGDEHLRGCVVVPREVRQPGDEVLAPTEVQPGAGLVEQQELGVRHQRASDLGSLALALAQGPERTVRVLSDPPLLHEDAGALPEADEPDVARALRVRRIHRHRH